ETARHRSPASCRSRASQKMSGPQRWVYGIAGDGEGHLIHACPGGYVEGLAVRPAESQIGDVILRNRHSPQQLALRADHVDALGHVGDLTRRPWSANACRHPEVALHIDPHSVAAAA